MGGIGFSEAVCPKVSLADETRVSDVDHIDVLGLGAVAVDFVGTVAIWPEEGAEQLVRGVSIHGGVV